MGHYRHNRLNVQDIFKKIKNFAKTKVEFIDYHKNPSGNFVFVDSGEGASQMALEAVQEATGLRCLVRTFSDLKKVNEAVPPNAQETEGRSVFLTTKTGPKKLIHVALSKAVVKTARSTGEIGARVEILGWPSSQDVLCLYDRQKRRGSVGQVTTKVRDVLRSAYPDIYGDIYGTGRALSVIRNLLNLRDG